MPSFHPLHLAALFFLLATTLDAVRAVSLNVTVIGAHDGKSRFECWELRPPFLSSTQPGVVGSQTTTLGDVANITYNVIPAGFDSGFHVAPTKQWVVLLHGLGVITLPDNNSSTTASVTTAGGELGLLLATDTAAVSREGHGSFFPGVTETVILQIPVEGDAVPEHRVLTHDAPCSADEYSGLRGFATG